MVFTMLPLQFNCVGTFYPQRKLSKKVTNDFIIANKLNVSCYREISSGLVRVFVHCRYIFGCTKFLVINFKSAYTGGRGDNARCVMIFSKRKIHIIINTT